MLDDWGKHEDWGTSCRRGDWTAQWQADFQTDTVPSFPGWIRNIGWCGPSIQPLLAHTSASALTLPWQNCSITCVLKSAKLHDPFWNSNIRFILVLFTFINECKYLVFLTHSIVHQGKYHMPRLGADKWGYAASEVHQSCNVGHHDWEA